MNARLTFEALVLVILASSTVSAQSPCAEGIKAVHEERRNCLDNTISVDDRNPCEEIMRLTGIGFEAGRL